MYMSIPQHSSSSSPWLYGQHKTNTTTEGFALEGGIDWNHHENMMLNISMKVRISTKPSRTLHPVSSSSSIDLDFLP